MNQILVTMCDISSIRENIIIPLSVKMWCAVFISVCVFIYIYIHNIYMLQPNISYYRESNFVANFTFIVTIEEWKGNAFLEIKKLLEQVYFMKTQLCNPLSPNLTWNLLTGLIYIFFYLMTNGLHTTVFEFDLVSV